jgi:phosphopantetheinyl transferase
VTRPCAIMTRYASLDRCPPEPQASLDWLGTEEHREYDRLRDANRRRQWLAGRWLGKQLMLHAAGAGDPADWQILSRNQRGQGVRPQIFRGGRELDWTLSISHSGRGVLVALAPDSAMSVGVDLATSVPTSAAFRRLWFTPSEQRWLADDPRRRTRDLWAIKEATYKAAHAGEAWNPREIEVVPRGIDRFDCLYRGQRLRRLALNLHEIDDQLAAVACLPREGAITTRSRMSQFGDHRPTRQTSTFFETHHD